MHTLHVFDRLKKSQVHTFAYLACLRPVQKVPSAHHDSFEPTGSKSPKCTLFHTWHVFDRFKKSQVCTCIVLNRRHEGRGWECTLGQSCTACVRILGQSCTACVRTLGKSCTVYLQMSSGVANVEPHTRSLSVAKYVEMRCSRFSKV